MLCHRQQLGRISIYSYEPYQLIYKSEMDLNHYKAEPYIIYQTLIMVEEVGKPRKNKSIGLWMAF